VEGGKGMGLLVRGGGEGMEERKDGKGGGSELPQKSR